jgi:hypothetical protein
MAAGKRRGGVRTYLGEKFRPFGEITRKYRTPRIKMTRQVKAALLLLRIYLIVIVGILIYKFFTSI